MRPLRILLLVVTTMACSLAHAQTYPTKLITLLVSFPAGGQAGSAARAIAPALQKELGQTVIVDNISGVGGALGAQKVLGAKSGGHTLMLGTRIRNSRA